MLTVDVISAAESSGGSTADCETRDDWLFEQDANAWSSLAYVAAGLILAREIGRRRLPRAVWGLVIAMVAEGFGSFLYHGAASDFGQFLHDVPLIGALAFVAGWHAGRLVGRSDRGSLIGLVVGMAVSSGIWALAPGATNIGVAVTIAVIVVASLIGHRRGLPGVWNAPILVLGAVAVGTWVLGTPNSPACDAESWVQPHSCWHLLTAIIAVAWVDLAYAAERPDAAPRMFRRFTDRTIGLLARGLVLAFHRSVDVEWQSRLPRDRPVLIVANHSNGFVDPVVVAGVLGHLPRFLAKHALWKVVIARPFLALAGVLPVYRSADGDNASDNASVFSACHRELAQGAMVAIFPEGTTGDRAGLDRVKSGAARIALGALATAPDLVIAPIGMAFENNVETRSRAVVMFGEPIVVADYVGSGPGPDGEPARPDAGALTDQITRSLEAISPTFATVDEREMLRAAARQERSESTHRAEPSFGPTEVVARRIAKADDPARERVIAAYRDFATRLQLIGLGERQLQPERVSLARIAVSAAAVVFAGPLLVSVTLIHLPAIAIVFAGTAVVKSTATKGTVRLLLGLVTMLATWTIYGVVLGDGWSEVAYAIAIAIGGGVALFVWPPVIRQAAILVGWVHVHDRVGLLPPVLDARSHLVEAVRASIDDDDE